MFGEHNLELESEWQGDFEQRYDGVLPLILAAQANSTSCDASLAPAHLLKTALLHAKLDSKQKQQEGDVEVQKPLVAEVMLMQRPLQDLLARLQYLLKEWPENPLLEQLSAISHRLLGRPLMVTQRCVPFLSAQQVPPSRYRWHLSYKSCP